VIGPAASTRPGQSTAKPGARRACVVSGSASIADLGLAG
jgi:hypothetical protein